MKQFPAWVALIIALLLLCSLGLSLSCLPTVPVFDHAIFLADLFNGVPRWFALHNEHRPLLPRLVFWVEAWGFGGQPLFPAMVALSALIALIRHVRRHTRGPWIGLGLALALFRPFGLVEWLRPTNLQYPLALLCSLLALHCVRKHRVFAGFFLAVLGVLSSAEGWLVWPLLLFRSLRPTFRHRALGFFFAGTLGLMAYLRDFHTVTVWPSSASDLYHLFAYLARLWGQPWAVGWGVYASLLIFVLVLFQHSQGWGASSRNRAVLGDLGAVGSLGFVAVVIGRWSLDMIVPRYSMGPTLAFSAALLRLSPRWGVVALGVFFLAELGGVVPQTLRTCSAINAESVRFWSGQGEDPSAAHPGLDPHIARELREHLWSQGLYLPR